ncbi:MAG: P-loop NTPase fold protein, partial [Nitrospinota bacterium]
MNQTAGKTSQHAMWSVLDRELSDRSKDAFGHQHYADLLGDLIEAEHHLPPFSIGLLGSWGTGKSTIKELYL